MTEMDTRDQRVILFDGVCNLCNGSVTFVLQHERKPIFQFASIQSDAGRELLQHCRLPADYLQSVILIENGKACFGTTAALKIGQTLRFPWSLLARMGFVVPTFIRDRTYDQIAKHRYQWFGRRDICMIPTKELKSRFL
jgi:predicted DCC family thiol-disulfide oxidoreductase YuxK